MLISFWISTNSESITIPFLILHGLFHIHNLHIKSLYCSMELHDAFRVFSCFLFLTAFDFFYFLLHKLNNFYYFLSFVSVDAMCTVHVMHQTIYSIFLLLWKTWKSILLQNTLSFSLPLLSSQSNYIFIIIHGIPFS